MFSFLGEYISSLSLRRKSSIAYLFILLLFILSMYYAISYLFLDRYLEIVPFSSLLYFLSFLFLSLILLVSIFFFLKYLTNELLSIKSYVDNIYKDTLLSSRLGNLPNLVDDTAASPPLPPLDKLKLMDNSYNSRLKEADLLNKHLFNLYNLSPFMFCVIRQDGFIVDVNEAFTRLLGLTRSNILGKSFFNFLSISTKVRFEDSLKYMDTPDLSGILNGDKSYLDLDIDGLSVLVFAHWNVYSNDSFLFMEGANSYKGDEKLYTISFNILDIDELRSTLGDKEEKLSFLSSSTGKINKLLSMPLDLGNLFNSVLKDIFELLSYDFGIILFSSACDEDISLNNYNIVSSVGLEGLEIDLDKGFNLGENARLLDVLRSGEGGIFKEFVLGNIIDTSSFSNDFDNYLSSKTSLLVPLVFTGDEGGASGIIILDTVRGKGFSELEFFVVELFSSVLVSVVRDILLKDELKSKNILMKSTMNELKKKDILFNKEMELAVSIQKGILPLEHYEWNGIRIESYYEAISDIGGDFFDYLHLPGGELLVFIADVSGHGIPAALITTMLKISVTSVIQRDYTLKSILSDINLDICNNVQTDDYISGFFLLIDKNYNISYINAGHQLALLFRRSSGDLISLDTGGYFFGISEELSKFYEEKRINFSYGDRIMLYTDGITEVTNANNEQYGVERLKDMLMEGGELSTNALKDRIILDVKEFAGGYSSLNDDLSLIVIELDKEYDKVIDVTTKGRERFSSGKYRESIIFFKRALELDPSNLDIMLMLGEASLRTFNFNDSVKYFGDYVSVKKDNIYAYYRLSLALFKLQDYPSVIKFCEYAIEINKGFTKALYLLGLTYKRLHNYSKAKSYFRKVLEIDPSNKKALSELKQ